MSTQDNILCDLSQLGLLEVSGPDALTFLQGQVTNDVNLLTGSTAHYSAYCTPKGRMLALFLAFSHNNHIHLQLNRELIEPIMKRLKMYVLRAKVEIKDVSDDISIIGIDGPEAASILALCHAEIPQNNYEFTSVDGCTILKLPTISEHTRFKIFAKKSIATEIFDALKSHCKIVERPSWDLLEIQAGIPDVTLRTQEQFVPQMLNLDILKGINFKKGCYTGQEIVARTHYLGTVKRRTFLGTISSAQRPAEGDKVLDAEKAEVGQIVRVAQNQAGSFDALIELRIDAQEAGNITWDSAPIHFKPLPYELD